MEGDSDIFLVDTNVLIYAYEKEESEKRTRAFKLLVDCFSDMRNGVSCLGFGKS